ncbi:DUF2254 domain-containing protein [Solwaraspora sp. WMMD1047]|uniref:DUF2254 domain-containing protein n=1 Tax=Solwaraspora sp. WMMD1047 TaxID=3016102 RepID=UPI002418093D|nr:DUF2254 domain-containing protein [Solwaraspora sp. WMMD1047]MDG4831967.1 DUF2254 domain-containing protein [Solwaraspora sp. WMMD1047]
MNRPGTVSSRLAEVWESFWVLPAVCAIGAVVVAIGLSVLELRFEFPVRGLLPSGAAGARSLLSSIITAMISFTALVFSITVVALQLVSSQYSPRVLRTFLQDRVIQLALGTFVATFLFAMVVLAALPGADTERLPELALATSMALVLASSGVFIYYLHHITTVMRVSQIIAAIGAQTRHCIDQHLPAEADDRSFAVPGEVVQVIRADRPGMITRVDLNHLAALARQHDCAISVVPTPGDFVPEGVPLLRVHQVGDAPPRRVDPARAARGVEIAAERTPGQDIGFGFRQLADIAGRALSPGVNDLTTAVRAVQEAHDLLRRVGARPLQPHVVRDDAATVRVRVEQQSYDSLLAMVVDEVRSAADGQPRIVDLLGGVVADLETVVRPSHRLSVRQRSAR